jgi:hypothetical protein
MADQTPSEIARVENVLRTVDHFKPLGTRRAFMTRLLAAGGVAAIASSPTLFGNVTKVFADAVTDFGNAAVAAERISIAFYANALGAGSAFGVPSDLAKGQLLNAGHRVYFQAAMGQEQTHLDTLKGLGLDVPAHVFSFPAGTFTSASSMLAFGEKLEDIFIGAYLGAIKVAAAETNAFIAEAAAQIMGVECEHRVLIRDIAALTPPNDRLFEGDLASNGSTVYATAGDAVSALLALGISVVS